MAMAVSQCHREGALILVYVCLCSYQQEGDTKVVMLSGKLDTNTTPATESKINALLDGGASKLLINFEQLNYISSYNNWRQR